MAQQLVAVDSAKIDEVTLEKVASALSSLLNAENPIVQVPAAQALGVVGPKAKNVPVAVLLALTTAATAKKPPVPVLQAKPRPTP